jgi:polyhydroxybutyrate depolymerase
MATNRRMIGWLTVPFGCAVLACSAASPSAGAGPGDAGVLEDAGEAGEAGEPGRDGGPADARIDFPAVATTPGRYELTFTHAGLSRALIVYIPKGYSHTDARPLMVSLHGGGGSAKKMFAAHPLEARGDESGYVMVAAQGTPTAGGGYDWNPSRAFDTSADDDVGYLERVILGLSVALKIDPKRRYVAGFSGGATMTVRFGTEKPELLAAIGTFAGKVGRSASSTPPFVFPSAPATPLSVQMTYGTLDDNYTGGLKEGILFTSAKEGIAWWAQALSCAPSPQTETNGNLTLDTYSACASGTTVRMVTVAGMDHMWPEKADGLDGTKLLLDFFRDKVRP